MGQTLSEPVVEKVRFSVTSRKILRSRDKLGLPMFENLCIALTMIVWS